MSNQLKYRNTFEKMLENRFKLTTYVKQLMIVFIFFSALFIYNTNHNIRQMKIFKNQGLKRGSAFSSNKQNEVKLRKDRASSFSIMIAEYNQKIISNSQTTKCSTSNRLLPALSSTQTENKPFQRQRKPSLIIKQQKPSLCLQKNYNRTISKKIQILQGQINMPNIFQKIVRLLENNFIISQKQSNLFLIKKQDLSKLLQNCLLYKTSFSRPQFLQNNLQFNNLLLKIHQSVQEQKKRDKKSKLALNSTVYDNYTNKDYNNDYVSQQAKISKLLTDSLELQRKIQELSQFSRNLVDRNQFIAKVISEKQLNLKEFQEKIQQSSVSIVNLQKIIQEKQQFFNKMQRKYEQIFNFVGNQNKNKHVKMASEQYKLIQADIYDYAAYLQANQLASGLTYQHLPIVCHTHDLQERISTINKMLIQNQELSIKEKGRRLRDFLLQVVQKYRKKDIEVEKLMSFKTKCIVTFIDHMKKWLNNWQLKQEYLKNLRMEHAYNNEKILTLFEQISSMNLCKSCRQLITPRRKTLLQLYTKMHENYKMGNSFY